VHVLRALELVPDAMALIVSVAQTMGRGSTMRDAAKLLRTPFSDVGTAMFEDPYQVPRVLKPMLDAPVLKAGVAVLPSMWLEKVMKTPILEKPLV
jgi:hypothetical protein